MNVPQIPALLTSSGRPGFYMRVLRDGDVAAGDEIVRLGQANDRMTVAEINALLYSPNHPHDLLARAVALDALAPGWRRSFDALLHQAGSGNAGLAPHEASHPAAAAFRALTVATIDRDATTCSVTGAGRRRPCDRIDRVRSPEDVRGVLDAGFQLHIAKPVMPDALLRAVRACARHG